MKRICPSCHESLELNNYNFYQRSDYDAYEGKCRKCKLEYLKKLWKLKRGNK